MFNLNAPIDRYSPPLYGRNATKHRLIPEPGDTGFDDELDTFNPQAGSQWDSLAHVPASPGNFYNGVTVPQIRQSHRNTVGHWVAHGIAGRGVMLDVERFVGASPGRRSASRPGSSRSAAAARRPRSGRAISSCSIRASIAGTWASRSPRERPWPTTGC